MRLFSLLGISILTIVTVFTLFGMMVASDLAETKTQVSPKIDSIKNTATLETNLSNESEGATLGVTDSEVNADALYGLINAHRLDFQLSKLRVSPLLEQSAALKLQTMISEKYWRHENTKDQPPWQYFSLVGYKYKLAGENLSFGATTTWNVFSNWIKSPAHNAELLTPDYREMGIATDCDSYDDYASNTCIVVLHLGST